MGKTGYPRRCNRGCGAIIWMQKGTDGYWRAIDFPDNTLSGNWENHKGNCQGVA